jgi:hypothetical protein
VLGVVVVETRHSQGKLVPKDLLLGQWNIIIASCDLEQFEVDKEAKEGKEYVDLEAPLRNEQGNTMLCILGKKLTN